MDRTNSPIDNDEDEIFAGFASIEITPIDPVTWQEAEASSYVESW